MSKTPKKKVKKLKERLPKHVAIIMDGNGRWAKEKNLDTSEGHKAGVKVVKKIVRFAGELELEALTLYTFSKQNWRRSEKEVRTLMKLLKKRLYSELQELNENNVQLMVSGDMEGLPYPQRKAMQYGISKTSDNQGLILNLALNYGGREEILKAVKEIAQEVQQGELSPDEIDKKKFEQHLYTADLPDPDLIIRTSGELRLSNFLLWQSSYSEIYISEKYWPDFTEEDFSQALLDFVNRERRFGGRNTE